MNAGCRKITWITRLYLLAMSLFPDGYRREFGDELIYAVCMGAVEAEEQGRSAFLRFAWRELRDLPMAILRAHLHERRSPMDLRPGAHLPGGPIRGWQLGTVFLPFLLILIYPLRFWAWNHGMPWFLAAVILAFLLLVGLVWIPGIDRKFPLWALPGLGALLAIGSAILQSIAQAMVFLAIMLPIYGGWPESSLVEKIGVMLLVQLLYLAVMVVAVALLLRAVPAFFARVRQDWTLLSFLLYGIALFSMVGYDEFHGTEWFEVASLLVLAAGAGLYLLAPWRWLRVLALVLPAILSPVLMSYALYLAFPSEAWAVPSNLSFRLWESLQPVLYQAPLPILLVLAALAPRLPWKAEAPQMRLPEPGQDGLKGKSA
jgi:hypothetical protein